jgi:hypothetical protein
MALFNNDYMTGPPDYRAMRQLTGTQAPQAQQQNPLDAFLRMFEMVMQGNAAQTEAALKPRGKISTDEKNTFGRVGRQPGKSGLETWAAMNPDAPRGQEAIDASRGQGYQNFRQQQAAMRDFLAGGGNPQANDPERIYQSDPFTALEIDYHNMMNGDRVGPAASAATQAILDRMRQLDPTRAAEFVGKGYTSGPSQGQWVNDPLGRRPPKATPVDRYPNPSTGQGPIYDGEVPPKAIPVAGAPVDPPIGRAVPVEGAAQGLANYANVPTQAASNQTPRAKTPINQMVKTTNPQLVGTDSPSEIRYRAEQGRQNTITALGNLFRSITHPSARR